MKICTFCGAENLDAAHFCAACGNVFERTQGEEPAEGPEAHEAEERPSESPITDGTPKTEAVPGDDNGDGIADLQYGTEADDGEDPHRAEDGAEIQEDETGFDPDANVPVTTEEEFYGKIVPDRVKRTLKSLVTYLWLCAVLNLLIGAAMWQDLWMMIPSLLIAATDAVLAIFVRKRRRWAAVTGIVYSAVGGLLFTGLGFLRGEGIGATRVLLGWLCSLGLFIGALTAIREIGDAWQAYSRSGSDPWDTDAERQRAVRFRMHDKVNRIVIGVVAGALAVVLITVFAVLGAESGGAPDAGVWEKRSYTNAYFEFSYELPENWTRMSDDVLAETNRYYYGGTDLGRYGGELFEAYDRASYEEATALIAVTAVRQDSDQWTEREVLEDWLADTAEVTEAEDIGYSCGEIGTQILAGESFVSVKETFLYPADDGSGALLPEIKYTYVRQVGHYTLTVELFLWEPFPEEPEDLYAQRLLLGFAEYLPAETSEE